MRNITEIKKGEQKLIESEQKLKERVKELTCLYELSKLVEDPDIYLGDIFYGIIALFPNAMRFSGLTENLNL